VASESVQILIEAEDKASAKVAAAAQAIDQNIKSVKDTGAKAKASTEFIGVLAGQLGGTELASYAGQLAGVTEKVGQFAEMQKAGGAGALAFKAGLVGLVATLAFNVGQSIGNAIFKTDKWNRLLEESRARIQELRDAANTVRGMRFAEDLEDVQLIKNPDEQAAAARELYDSIDKNLQTVEARYGRGVTALDKMRNATDALGRVTGERGRNLAAKQDELAADVQLIDQMRAQKNEIGKIYGIRALEVKAIKDKQQAEDEAEAKRKQISANSLSQMQALRQQYNELTMSAEDAKMAQMLAEGKSEQDAKIIVNLQKMVDLEKEKADAKKKADDEEKARIQKIDDLRKSELERLQEQKIAIEQGEQAAHAFRLQQQGLDQGTAEAIAAAQAAMDASKEKKDAKAIEQTSNAAFESRLLSRGPREDDQKKIVENTKLTVEQLGKVEEAIKKLEPLKTPNSDRVKFEVIK
jgi:hypothetical protein